MAKKNYDCKLKKITSIFRIFHFDKTFANRTQGCKLASPLVCLWHLMKCKLFPYSHK